MASFLFNSFPEYLVKGDMDFNTDTFMMALIADSYTPDATDIVWAEVEEQEVVGDGYVSGGNEVTSMTVSHPSAAVTKVTGTIAAWTAATFTARYAVMYNSTSSPTRVAFLFDFGENKSVTAGTFQLTANASGLFTIQQSA